MYTYIYVCVCNYIHGMLMYDGRAFYFRILIRNTSATDTYVGVIVDHTRHTNDSMRAHIFVKIISEMQNIFVKILSDIQKN